MKPVSIHILEFIGFLQPHRKLSNKCMSKLPYFLDFFQIYCQKSNFSFCDVPKAGFSARSLPLRLDFSAESAKSPTFASYAGNKKTMIVITIAFVSCFNWLRSVMERYADAVTSAHCQFIVSGFVGLLTYLFMRRGFSPLRKRIASAFSRSHDSSSNDRFSPHAGCILHGKQYFRNTATLGNPLCFV